MDEAKKKSLTKMALQVRMGAIEGVFHAKSGHPGGSLSVADVLTYLYFEEMKVDPQKPHWKDRDRFVLSKGHAAPALYATLANRGFFSVDLLKTLRKIDSILQGHPNMKQVPGIDMSTGSLGQGISTAVGMALSAKASEDSYRVYTVLGDGELGEGQVWEAAAEQYGGVSFVFPYVAELERQYDEAVLFEKLGTKDAVAFQTEIKKLIAEVFGLHESVPVKAKSGGAGKKKLTVRSPFVWNKGEF